MVYKIGGYKKYDWKLPPLDILGKIEEINSDMQELKTDQLTKMDIKSIEDNTSPANPLQAIKNKWDTLPNGVFFLVINCGTINAALVQKLSGGNFGSVIIMGYSLSSPIYAIKENENWTNGFL